MTATLPREEAGGRARRRALNTVVASTGISSLGDGVRLVGLPLVAAASTRSPLGVAAVTAAGRLPWLLGPVLGVVVDRSRRLHLIARVDLGRAVLVAGLGVAVALGVRSIAVFVAFAVLLGLMDVLADSAAQTVVPLLVADDELESGNAKVMAVQTTATQFAGPAVGGWLSTLSLALPFGFDAVTFVASSMLVARVRDYEPASPLAGAPPEPFRTQIAEGLRWLWHDRVVRLLTVIVTGLGLLDGMVGAILVLFALDELGTGRAGFGLLLSVAAVGSIVGTLAAPRLARRARVKTLLVVSTVGAGTAYLLMAGARAAPVAAIFLAANSAMVMLWNVLTVSLRQRLIAPELLGRVTACYRMAAWGALPLGGLLGGALAGQIGIRSVVVTAGAGLVLLSALVLRLPGDAVQPRPVEGSGA